MKKNAYNIHLFIKNVQIDFKLLYFRKSIIIIQNIFLIHIILTQTVARGEARGITVPVITVMNKNPCSGSSGIKLKKEINLLN